MIAAVLAHPCPESFVATVFVRVVSALETAAVVEPLDLYVDGYCPGQPLSDMHCRVLERSSTLILVYPTWWSAQPAILNAWLVAAAAQDLRHMKRLVCVTTHGGGRLVNRIIGQSGRMTVARAFRARCAPNASFEWIACYGLDSSDIRRRENFLDRVHDELGRSGHRPSVSGR